MSVRAEAIGRVPRRLAQRVIELRIRLKTLVPSKRIETIREQRPQRPRPRCARMACANAAARSAGRSIAVISPSSSIRIATCPWPRSVTSIEPLGVSHAKIDITLPGQAGKSLENAGESGWDRTIDTLIKSQVLYH